MNVNLILSKYGDGKIGVFSASCHFGLACGVSPARNDPQNGTLRVQSHSQKKLYHNVTQLIM
ncbi:hypothetical protein BDP55DRAFT_642893 [Colletotrichum godetiae]|uniref:Uncharacterized protein n=1 Tax=Colletotrichum godetiae TaxID=1209918 RepID=A0AAJ0F282_9PEZI|nr:uncharacterized protein BDP55DRAFT_642893 [Colletotrichum godetiae]KAK1700424.1 hypothetical protein BDP55DRAFT_642893 [Colletotrichum godetiae]